MAFNDADGSEDKTAYNQLVTVMKAMASARDTSGLFNEAGSDHSGATDPVEKLNALIEERMSKYDESRGDATMAVIERHPELYAEYDTATVRSVGHAQRGED